MTESEELAQKIADLQMRLSSMQSGPALSGLKGIGGAIASQIDRENSEKSSMGVEVSQVRGRGRPRRSPVAVASVDGSDSSVASEKEVVKKRGRGRPPKSGIKLAKVKKIKLPSLLQQISKENPKGLTVIEFTEKVKSSNYEHSSNDIGNMVYQCLRRMVKANIFKQVIEGDKRLYIIGN
jgi:hypothetical protein